jgi:hypothetical protein
LATGIAAKQKRTLARSSLGFSDEWEFSGCTNFDDDIRASHTHYRRMPPKQKTTTPILMDQILIEYVNQAFEATRLGRNGVHSTRDLVFAEVLGQLEALGDAMRFVDTNGRIAWKATPSLCQYVMDVELDAQEDLEDI